MKYYELLCGSQFFRGLTPAEIENFLKIVRGEMITYEKNDFLYRGNQYVDRFGIIVSGWVKVTRVYSDGSRIHLQSLLDGSCVGLDIVTTRKGISPFDVIAADKTQVFYMPADVVLTPGILNIELQMKLLTNVLTLVSKENIKNYYRIETLANNGLRRRIESFLLKEYKRAKSPNFTIRFNREELADYLCVNRSALSHELSVMRSEGLIEFERNEFEIKKPMAMDIYY